jgi:hypothetical protein
MLRMFAPAVKNSKGISASLCTGRSPLQALHLNKELPTHLIPRVCHVWLKMAGVAG